MTLNEQSNRQKVNTNKINTLSALNIKQEISSKFVSSVFKYNFNKVVLENLIWCLPSWLADVQALI